MYCFCNVHEHTAATYKNQADPEACYARIRKDEQNEKQFNETVQTQTQSVVRADKYVQLLVRAP